MKLKFTSSTLLLATLISFSNSSLAVIIRPVSVLSEEYVYNSANQLIDNSGLSSALNSGDSISNAYSVTHVYDTGWKQSYSSTNPGGGGSTDFFASIGSDTDVDILLDLSGGGDVIFRSVLLWQYQNNGGGADRAGNALRTMEIRINTDAQGTNSFSTAAAATVTMKPVVDGDQDTSNDLGGINSVQMFSTGMLSGRYVLLSLTDNHYHLNGMTRGGDRVGLGEIRFATEPIPVPEPTALAFVLFISGGFLFIKRRFD